MGANLYGVANPLVLPQYFTPPTGSLINCPGNAETVFATSPAMATISQGVYYPMVWACVAIQWGATNPGIFNMGWRIGNGADLNQFAVNQNQFIANGASSITYAMFGPPSAVVWKPPGAVLNFTMNMTTAVGIEINPTGSWFVCTLYRAPDQ